MKICMMYMTASSMIEARTIARELVSARLAACANILEPVESIYWWKGNMEEAKEVVVLFKTREALVQAFVEKARALHSYECPCIVSLPIQDGHEPFLQWVEEETASPIF